MRPTFRLVLLFSLIGCGHRTATTNQTIKDSVNIGTNSGRDSSSHRVDRIDSLNEILKSTVVGKWQQTNDKKQTIIIKKDSMIDIYDKKIISTDRILFAFEDSAYKYYKGNNIFNFDSSLNSDKLFKIQIISKTLTEDTMTNIILYVDLKHLEIGYNRGTASFKRIK